MYQSIYNQNNACDHKKIENEYLHFVFDIRMIVR